MGTDESVQAITDVIAADREATKAMMAKRATYKIQVRFRHDRTGRTHTPYTLSFWESGKRLHGGGDEMMFVCRRLKSAPKPKRIDVIGAKNPSDEGCHGLIPGDQVTPGGLVVCPHCQQRWNSACIGDSVYYNTDMDTAAEIIERWWRKLGCDADLFVKFAPTDPRTLLHADAYGIQRAKELQGLVIYPLENILRDTMSGAEIKGRFKALLLA